MNELEQAKVYLKKVVHDRSRYSSVDEEFVYQVPGDPSKRYGMFGIFQLIKNTHDMDDLLDLYIDLGVKRND